MRVADSGANADPLCNTTNSDRTGKEDNNEFCLIEVRVPLRLSVFFVSFWFVVSFSFEFFEVFKSYHGKLKIRN